MKNKITDTTILVTGGAGFVGSYVVEELLQHQPARVIIIDNLIRGSHKNMRSFAGDPRVEFIEGDIRDTLLLEKAISRCDYVFHMAALRINACAANPREGFDVMLQATFQVADLSKQYNIKKVIYSSSASVYGLAQHFPTPETDNPYNNQTFYGGAKLWGEQLFRSYKFLYGLDYVALRYFNVYGERMDTDGKYTEVMIKWLDCIRDGREPVIFGDGTDTMDFVHVADVAHCNILALLSDVTDEVFNVGVQKETSLNELLDTLLRVNQCELRPVFREANSVNPVKRRIAGLDKIRDMLGYQPSISLEDGLNRLSAWYFEMQKIT